MNIRDKKRRLAAIQHVAYITNGGTLWVFNPRLAGFGQETNFINEPGVYHSAIATVKDGFRPTGEVVEDIIDTLPEIALKLRTLGYIWDQSMYIDWYFSEANIDSYYRSSRYLEEAVNIGASLNSIIK